MKAEREFTPKPGFDFPGPPPTEALDYWRAKGLKVGFDYRDVWREEHAASFTVAKMMELDLLGDVRASLDTALSEGQTYRAWAKALKPELAKRGWWGIDEREDPETGEMREVELGSPRRLRTIYRTNLRTARAAGQWRRIERRADTHPYLLYSLGPSRTHRPEHVRYHGLLLPWSDPFWATHYPPNGWGCKCRVRQVSKREADRLVKGGVPDLTAPLVVDKVTGLPTGHRERRVVPVRLEAPEVTFRPWLNKRTGDMIRVADGCDPGWDYNVGQRGRLPAALDQVTAGIEAAGGLGQASIRDLVDSPVFEDWLEDPEGKYPVMRLPDVAAEAIGAKGRVVSFSAESALKNLDHHPDLTPEHYRRLPRIGEDPDIIVRDTERTVVMLKQEEKWDWAVVKATTDGSELYLTSYRRVREKSVERLFRRPEVDVIYEK